MKTALLVGCNYPNTPYELKGCINDVHAMRDVILKRFNFDPQHVELITDEPGSPKKTTRANIMAGLEEMVKEAKEGDVLLFHFSGHGVEADMKPGRKDDAIVPCDLNLIYDVDIRHLIEQLPKETSFTIVSDSCHSGGLIDKEKEQIGPHSTLRGIAPSVDARKRGISLESIHQGLQTAANVINAASDVLGTTVAFSTTGLDIEPRSLTEDEGILLSGCQADELSLDLEPSDKTQGKAYGAFTYSLQKIINETNGTLTNKQLVMNVRDEITSLGFHEQHPCLYCSDKNAGTAFLATIPTPLALPMINELVPKKKAVLVGCNYPRTPYNLKGCINDLENIRMLIMKRFNFDQRFIKVLTDNYIQGSWDMPTGIKIKAALYEMVRTARPGDVLFFYFSGHGTAVPVLKPGQPLRLDEAIVPCDFNLITDVDFRGLVNQLPNKVNFTILSDSCHSGGLIDKEEEQIGPNTLRKGEKSPECITRGKSIEFPVIHEIIDLVSDAAHQATNIAEQFFGFFGRDIVSLKFNDEAAKQKGLLGLRPHEDKGILVSGCEAYETSFDVVLDGKSYGAFTDAEVKVSMGGYVKMSNKDLVTKARDILKQNGFDQSPCLYCSNADLDADFLGEVA
ncbi:hypothetical protein ES332_D06G232600v1 [Gossypium tomentosum]|uniref:Peptidase C14 caspase domain-containing protein n=1 Tax=Gossypium tomentosum TaxID=34277 RepID=A0A5D2KMM1_GOSTO|nr:hypothetical protein ES332_D06G232600v1 [Gossypium tomentosum]